MCSILIQHVRSLLCWVNVRDHDFSLSVKAGFPRLLPNARHISDSDVMIMDSYE